MRCHNILPNMLLTLTMRGFPFGSAQMGTYAEDASSIERLSNRQLEWEWIGD
jgi:hypothetical protein